MMVGQKAIYRSKICEGSRLLRREASLLPLSAEKRRRPSGGKAGLWPRAGDFLPLAKKTTRSLRPEWTAVLQKTAMLDLVYLVCSDLKVTLPRRNQKSVTPA